MRSFWKPIFISAAVATILLFALLALWYSRFLSNFDSYCDVHRDDNKKEVLYRLGYPPTVIGPPEKTVFEDVTGWDGIVYSTDSNATPLRAMPANKSINDFDHWLYTTARDDAVTIKFNPNSGTVERVSCMADTIDACPKLAYVGLGDTEDDVQRILGTPTGYELVGVSKRIRYDDLGVEYLLTKNKVYMLTFLTAEPRSFRRLVGFLKMLPNKFFH